MFCLGLIACQPAEPIAPNIPDSTQAANSLPPQLQDLQVYFNHNPDNEYTEPYRNITRSGDNLEQVILDTLRPAKKQIDMAVQEFRLPEVAKMLRDRAKAGVKVRVILENTYTRPYSSYTDLEIKKLPPRELKRYEDNKDLIDINQDGQLTSEEIEQRDAIVILKNAGIEIIDDRAGGRKGTSLMHHKFIVIDNQHVIVTSANFTMSDIHGDLTQKLSRGNPNSLLKINSSDLARVFNQEFNLMWGDRGKTKPRFGNQKPLRGVQSVQVGTTQVEVRFSPSPRKTDWQQTVNGRIAQTLSRSQTSVDLALFVFSDQALVNVLEPRRMAGVKMRGLMDAGFMYRPYSSGLDMLGVASWVCPESSAKTAKKPAEKSSAKTAKKPAGKSSKASNSKLSNHPWKSPIQTVGVPKLPPGDLLHHKFAIIDRNTVIVGSHNWTEAANHGNDETLLIIHSPVVATYYEREFDRLYNNAILGIPPAVQKRFKQERKNCSKRSLKIK